MNARVAKSWGIVIAVAAAACTSKHGDAPAAVDAGDAADSVPPPQGDFSCVGQVTTVAPATTTAKVLMHNIDAFSNVPLHDAVVKVCARDDVACAAPSLQTTTDENGIATMPALPLGANGFDGYFEVSVGDEPRNLNFVSPSIHRDQAYRRVYWSLAALTRIADIVGTKYDPQRGHVFVEAHDCTGYANGTFCTPPLDDIDGCLRGQPGGVAFELDVQDPAIVLGYLYPPSISRDAGGTYAGIGQGGFVNVPPGPVTLTAKIAQTGQVVARQKLFVRAGAFSMVTIFPTPL